jgi:hypothetical protein
VGIISDAVDTAVAAGLIQLGIKAHLGEQVLDEGLELLRGEFQEIGTLVDVGDDIDRIDDPRVGHAERHDWFDGDQFIGVRGDVGEEVPADALDRGELRLV